MSVHGFFSVTNLFLILFLIHSTCCLIFAAVVSYCAPMMHPTIGILELNPSDTRLRPGMSRNTIIRVSRWISQSGVIPLDHFSSSHVNRVPQGLQAVLRETADIWKWQVERTPSYMLDISSLDSCGYCAFARLYLCSNNVELQTETHCMHYKVDRTIFYVFLSYLYVMFNVVSLRFPTNFWCFCFLSFMFKHRPTESSRPWALHEL